MGARLSHFDRRGPIMANDPPRAFVPSASTQAISTQNIVVLREASARWDLAWAALSRRDYVEYDRITGFKGADA